MKKFKQLGGVVVALAILLVGMTYAGHRVSSSAIEAEWEQKFPSQPRSAKEMGSILSGMIQNREVTTPAFVPRYQWGRALCAAAVVNGVAAVLGKPGYLHHSASWAFQRKNADKVNLVYTRGSDFTLEGVKIVEKVKRPLPDFKKIMDPTKVYVVGYIYNKTLAGPLIAEAGEMLNSHLMLAVGESDGTFWGYHQFHDPAVPDHDPFAVVDLVNYMPQMFKLIYVWEIKGITVDRTAKGKFLFQKPKYYHRTEPLLGWFGANRIGYLVDKILVHFLDEDGNFPETRDTPLARR